MERFLPLCWTGSPISPEAARLPDSLFVTWGAGLGLLPPGPWEPSQLPPPATSPRSCQQLEQTGGSHCLHSGLESTGQRPPNGKYTLGHGGIVSQLASWAMEAGPEAAHHPDGGEGEPRGLLGR